MATGRAPGDGYGGARARARAWGGSFRVQRGRRGALGLLFIGTGAGNLGGCVRGIGRRWIHLVDAAQRGRRDR